MTKIGFRFAGIWRDNGQPLLLPLLKLYMAAMFFAGAIAIIMYAAIIPDIVAENEHRTGLQQEGMLSKGIAIADKSTTALGLFVRGFITRHQVPGVAQSSSSTAPEDATATVIDVASQPSSGPVRVASNYCQNSSGGAALWANIAEGSV